MTKLITKESLRTAFMEKMLAGEKVIPRGRVDVVGSAFGSAIPRSGVELSDAEFRTLNSLKSIHRGQNIVLSGRYQSGLEYKFGDRGSIIDRVAKGAFSSGGGNTLNDNWQDLFDAIRLDLTIRKAARPTLREDIYDVIPMPNSTKDVRPTELFPYGVVFETNNGEGQSVKQAANLGGKYDTIPQIIYAAGWQWTLLAQLFDDTYDLSRLTDGVAVGESAKKDDIALAPIINGTYTGAKATAASTEGTGRQEKLMNTLMDGIDDLGERTDPTTKRKVGTEGLVILAHTQDARHIQHVMSGLGNSTPEKYTPLTSISKVLGYDGETIDMPDEVITYDGVPLGTCFMIKPNRYFRIPVKRDLTMEIDATPDVQTLKREQRAWYFVEAIFNDVGIDSFVQKITLPAW